jgi:hypothetical protein
VSNIFDVQGGREDPMVPVALTPLAAQDGIDDDGSDDGSDDSPGVGLDFFISLGAKIGSLADAIDSDRADRRRQAPGDAWLQQSGTAGSSGIVVLDMGSVPQGRVWDIRRMVVGGAKVTSSPAGSAYAFVQGAPPTDLSITNCVDIFLTLPQGDTYGTHQLFMTRGEHLWVVFSGAANGTQYAASARIEDWAETTYYSTFAE